MTTDTRFQHVAESDRRHPEHGGPFKLNPQFALKSCGWILCCPT